MSIIERKEKAVFEYIEKHHKQLWPDLDMNEETIIFKRSGWSNFFLQKEYIKANDPELNRKCKNYETLGKFASYYGLFVVLLGTVYIIVIPWLETKYT